MANSTTAGSPAPITAEYLSEYKPLELLIFQQHLKRSDNSHRQAGGDRNMWTSTLSEIKSKKDQADRIRLTKQCKIIGQKSDKAKSKLLKQEVFSREGNVLQNLYSAVRSRPAPLINYKLLPVQRWRCTIERGGIQNTWKMRG